jgi:hypothetical protein
MNIQINSFFDKDENVNLDKILIDNKYNIDSDIILVYTLKYNTNNNRILILTNKTTLDIKDVVGNGFDIYHIEDTKENICDILDTKKYNYIFTQSNIKDLNYRFKTHFYLKYKKYTTKNEYVLLPYNYVPQKLINNIPLKTYINLDINYNMTIPDYIHNDRPNYGKSTIIWSPSLNNFSDDHWIAKVINNIGFSYYKRKTNLIHVLNWNDKEKVKKYNNIINNPLNICIYQETEHNPLNFVNTVYTNWFFDVRHFRPSVDSLFIDQFPLYDIKTNVLRQKYNLPIDINSYNRYPNCLPVLFNTNYFLKIARSQEVNKYNRNNSCFMLRKTMDTHPLKMMDTISEHYIHQNDSLPLDGLSLEESIQLFLRCHTFYCYDLVSFLSVIAVLCGCKTILISDYHGFKDLRDIYKELNPFWYYGMSYYTEGEYIEPPENGREELIKMLLNINTNSYKSFSNETTSYNTFLTFLKYLECYFNVSF